MCTRIWMVSTMISGFLCPRTETWTRDTKTMGEMETINQDNTSGTSDRQSAEGPFRSLTQGWPLAFFYCRVCFFVCWALLVFCFVWACSVLACSSWSKSGGDLVLSLLFLLLASCILSILIPATVWPLKSWSSAQQPSDSWCKSFGTVHRNQPLGPCLLSLVPLGQPRFWAEALMPWDGAMDITQFLTPHPRAHMLKSTLNRVVFRHWALGDSLH